MMVATYSFQVGRLQCAVIQDGGVVGPVERIAGMFPDIPHDSLERELLRHGFDLNALPFSLNVLLVDTGAQRVLMDTGEGLPDSQLLDGLRALGVAPEAIDTVILTHGHRDHIGGIVDGDGKLIYANARYVMWRSEWEHWLAVGQQPDERSQYIRRNLIPIQDRVTLIEAEAEIVPGICVLPAPGHTVGHIALLLESDGERLLHIVDAAHQPVQVTITEWSPRFDMQPDRAQQTRRALVERAAREKLLVAAYHFGFPGLGNVMEQDGELVWQAAEI
ncbi:MAG: MBL fold metallo-hydrolase [Chloroflexi bacterium]|nr:MBL fold metallo-hydrolase [Chloroflexota bacterium]